ncbi:hypothetical protein Fmac_022502 [Flemingia macrophylla]|uniref:Uncharacterized protein n=1 Tax=Flemingia macrophylla TaxID=520843 RepID=A0ABD1M1N3_9FABA
MLIVAKGGKRGGCSATGCLVDLNGGCPAELRVARGNGSRGGVACRSACEAFGDPRQKVLGARKDGAQLPLVNKTMMYLSRLQSGGSSSPSGCVGVSQVSQRHSLHTWTSTSDVEGEVDKNDFAGKVSKLPISQRDQRKR